MRAQTAMMRCSPAGADARGAEGGATERAVPAREPPTWQKHAGPYSARRFARHATALWRKVPGMHTSFLLCFGHARLHHRERVQVVAHRTQAGRACANAAVDERRRQPPARIDLLVAHHARAARLARNSVEAGGADDQLSADCALGGRAHQVVVNADGHRGPYAAGQARGIAGQRDAVHDNVTCVQRRRKWVRRVNHRRCRGDAHHLAQLRIRRPALHVLIELGRRRVACYQHAKVGRLSQQLQAAQAQARVRLPAAPCKN